MNAAARLFPGLIAFLLLQSLWCGGAFADVFEECIEEPIFDGRVCTVQANRDASVGVILIHGLGGSVDDWKHTIPALATDFHVVAFDLPGFGKSDKGSQHYTPTRYARLAQYLADQYFQDKPYHVVGHSMGGAIALRFASRRPLRFQRLVLIDAAGILHPQAITKFQAGSMMQRVSGVQQTRGFAERFSGKILAQVERLPISPNDIVNSSLGRDYVLQGGPSRIAALDLAGEDFSSAIPAVSEPTLIIWGDNDLVAPLRTGRVLAERMPHARLEIIADSGHEPMQEQAVKLNALVRLHLLSSDAVMAEYYRQAAPPAMDSDRIGSCSGESEMLFEGDYRAIDLRGCTNVTIRNARVGQLDALDSRVTLVNTDIQGKDVGLHADNSDITITNGTISGAIAIDALRSKFDIAGARLKGSRASVRGVRSKFIFSVSSARSPHMDGPLHTYKNMGNEEL